MKYIDHQAAVRNENTKQRDRAIHGGESSYDARYDSSGRSKTRRAAPPIHPNNKEATGSLPWLLQLTTYETQLFLLLKPHALSFMELRNELIRIRRIAGYFRSKQ